MSKTTTTPQIKIVNIKSVLPDENQPRTYFAADKLKALADSIRSEGIISPIVVQEIGKDSYLIEDGERRFRAAQMLHLTEVPVLVRPATNATERMVQQFNLQEQHEAWTPVEKAVAITKLSEALGIGLYQVCKMLHLSQDETTRYVAFSTLVDKEAFVRNEVPLSYARSFATIKNKVRTLTKNALEQEYTLTDEKKLENRLIGLVKSGVVVRATELTKLSDAFTKDPKSIEMFMKDAKATPVSIFAASKAKGAYHLRNTMYALRYINTHGGEFLKIRDVKLSPDNLRMLKDGMETIQELINLAE